MTREQAIRIRAAQLKGEPVPALYLQQAIEVIQNTGTKIGRPHKLKLMKIEPKERERINGILLFNLGLAIGRMG
jgi:hypothetical protein